MTGRKKSRVRLLILAFSAAFLALSWFCRPFADLYVTYVFPVWGQTYGRLTSLLPFSLGEWAILAGLLWLLIFLICLVAALPAYLSGKKELFRKKMSPVAAITADLLTGICLIMVLNCFALYHCTPLDPHADERSFSVTELAALRNLIVEECNTRATQIPRDDGGHALFAGPVEDEARACHQRLGGSLFPRLAGYSVRPKYFFFSDFVSQQHMMGYYFPFTMEANINRRMEILNYPFTMCHELAHTHGYLFEDEANLIGFLACMGSEDPSFVYSGYLGILPYVDNDFRATVGVEIYDTYPPISRRVLIDSQFLTDESWAEVEENALLSTELVHEAADTFIDQNQKLNGISSGKASYSHVVALLLSYYSGEATYLQK